MKKYINTLTELSNNEFLSINGGGMPRLDGGAALILEGGRRNYYI